jgi:Flp pilus assembly protein TadG
MMRALRRLRRRPRDEQGAIAIMTAVLAVLLMVTGAMAVDLGNGMNRKKLTQNSADFAALAGASGLPITTSATTQLVADWLNKNQPVSDGKTDCNPDAGATITTGMLTDASLLNGDVTYIGTDKIRSSRLPPVSRSAWATPSASTTPASRAPPSPGSPPRRSA